MTFFSHSKNQILQVKDFQALVTTPFHGYVNAMCWTREARGDFSEIVAKLESDENIRIIEPEDLLELPLSEAGSLAREIILQDMALLKEHGAAPVLNLIRHYERDTAYSFFPTNVYSFHVDRSPVPTDTFLCTYYGEPSELVANDGAEQKIRIPEIRNELRKCYDGKDEDFETFLTEHFFDLHYCLKPGAVPVQLTRGHIWRLAVDHPESPVKPCVHRAPLEKPGEPRLLLIC